LKIIEKHEKFWSKPISLKNAKIYPKKITLETKEFFKIIQFHILFALYLLKYEIEGVVILILSIKDKEVLAKVERIVMKEFATEREYYLEVWECLLYGNYNMSYTISSNIFVSL